MSMKYVSINCFLLILFSVRLTQQGPINPKQQLLEHGYLKSMEADNETIKSAVKMYQQFFGLSTTGEIDEDTMNMMSLPRCGMATNVKVLASQLKWRKNHLTYKIRNSTEPFSKSQIKNVFESVIKSWLENINLDISESLSNYADIDIYFNEQDGKSNVVGYAYFPEVGDIYFDLAEDWTLDDSRSRGTHFSWVAAHELGHSLGLEHTNIRHSIMFPYYNSEVSNPSPTDKNNLLDLYGRASQLDNGPLCKTPTVDAVLSMESLGHIIIKGTQYWTFKENNLQNGPHSLDSSFPRLPDQVDAAFSVKKSTYFFKGDVYYKFKSIKKSYTKKLISVGFENVPSNIDAAFFRYNNGTIYFFKGSKYYAFHIYASVGAKLIVNGEKISKDWSGVPDDVEAATMLEDTKVLFMKNAKCYLFDLSTKRLLREQDCKSSLFKCST